MILYISLLTIVLCIVLFLYNSKINKNIIFLIGFLLPLSIYASYHYLLFFNDSAFLFSFINVHGLPLYYLAPPMLYFYVRNTLKDTSDLYIKDYIHFLPALIGLIAVLPFIFSDFNYKLKIAQLFLDDPNTIKSVHTHWFYPNYVNVILRPLQLFTYSTICLFIIWKYSRKNREYSPKYQQKLLLKWLTSISIVALLISINYTYLTYVFFSTENINKEDLTKLNVTLFAGITYTLIPLLIFAFPEILYGIPRGKKVSAKQESNQSKKSIQKINTEFQSQIPLSPVEESEDPLHESAQKIISYLNESKPFLDPKFNIEDLVTNLNIPKHHVYYCLNHILKEKFTTIRNNFRVEHAKNLLLSDQLKIMTIEAIGLTSGFASKSNFFAMFKDNTGLTPYEFVKKNSPDIKE